MNHRAVELLEQMKGVVKDAFTNDSVGSTTAGLLSFDGVDKYSYSHTDGWLKSIAVDTRGTDPVILTINGITLTVPAGVSFDESYEPFKMVEIKCFGSFEVLVRG